MFLNYYQFADHISFRMVLKDMHRDMQCCTCSALRRRLNLYIQTYRYGFSMKVLRLACRAIMMMAVMMPKTDTIYVCVHTSALWHLDCDFVIMAACVNARHGKCDETK